MGEVCVNATLSCSQTPSFCVGVCKGTYPDPIHCRERKRQKALETEQAANLLASQVKDFSLVKERYNTLNAENEALQRDVANADAQLARLRAEQQRSQVLVHTLLQYTFWSKLAQMQALGHSLCKTLHVKIEGQLCIITYAE